MEHPDRASLSPDEQKRFDLWTPFHERMRNSVIPMTAEMLEFAQVTGMERLFARIASHMRDGRDRSLSQKMPGWNSLLRPKYEHPSQFVPEFQPAGDEIVVMKTTDLALTGTNLRLILHNPGIRNVIRCGIFTDQCASSTVRSLADESYGVIVLEDCCVAATDKLHAKELEIINMIYCHVMTGGELRGTMKGR